MEGGEKGSMVGPLSLSLICDLEDRERGHDAIFTCFCWMCKKHTPELVCALLPTTNLWPCARRALKLP